MHMLRMHQSISNENIYINLTSRNLQLVLPAIVLIGLVPLHYSLLDLLFQIVPMVGKT